MLWSALYHESTVSNNLGAHILGWLGDGVVVGVEMCVKVPSWWVREVCRTLYNTELTFVVKYSTSLSICRNSVVELG